MIDNDARPPSTNDLFYEREVAMNFIEEKLCRFRVRIFAEDPFSELWIEMKKFRDAGLSSLELLAFLSPTSAVTAKSERFSGVFSSQVLIRWAERG